MRRTAASRGESLLLRIVGPKRTSIFSNRLMEHPTVHPHFHAPRCFAVKIDVGYGVYNLPNYFKHSPDSEYEAELFNTEKRTAKTVSPQQRRKADDELHYYQKNTTRILASQTLPQSSTSLNALLNEVRVTLHYWITRWHFFFHPSLAIVPTSVHDTATSFGDTHEDQYSDYGIKQADRLIDWIIQMDQDFPHYKIVDKTITIDENAVFVNLIDSCLLPCNTPEQSNTYSQVSASIERIDETKEPILLKKPFGDSGHILATKSIKNINVRAWMNALVMSARIIDKMQSLHAHGNNELQMDTFAINAILNVLSKQSVVMLRVVNSKDMNDIMNTNIDWRAHLPSTAIDDEKHLPSIFSLTCIQDLITRMESLLGLMENAIHSNTNTQESLKPDECSYNTIIATLARLNNVPFARERADWYLQRMERTEDEDLGRSSEQDHDKFPRTTAYADTVTYNSVIHAFASVQSRLKNRTDPSTREYSRYAASILKRMERRFEFTKRESVRPNTISYGAVLNGMANAGDAFEAERILESMIRRRNAVVEPSLICFNICITAWGKSGHPKAADFAQSLLKRLEEISVSFNRLDLRPDIISYSGVISALARSGQADSAHRAESILRRVIEMHNAGDERLRPDLITFNSVLGAWATLHKSFVEGSYRIKIGPNEALHRAESLFDEMHKMNYICPCTISYNIMLDLYSRIPDLSKTESLFKTMLERTRSNPALFHGPDIISYNSLLVAMVNDRNPKSVNRAVDLVLNMDGCYNSTDISHLLSSIKPDILSYNIVLGGLASRSANEAEEFLRSMEKRYMEGKSTIRPNRVSYNICIDAHAQLGSIGNAESLLHEMIALSKERNEPKLMPDVFTVTSVISAITKSKEMDAPNRAEKFLRDLGTTDAYGEIAPNRITFNNVINAWAKAGSPDRAEEILLRMEELSKHGVPDVAPDAISFSTVINAYAQKGQAQHAEKIFAMMEDRVGTGDSQMSPNAITYASLMNAWARSNDPDAPSRALMILEKMEKASMTGQINVTPNEQCYNTVINAFAKSNDPRKARKCLDLVRRMENPVPGMSIIKPSVITFSTVMNACAHTKGTTEECSEAFQIARSCMKEVLSKKYGQPNNIVFGTFLFSCTKLVKAGTERDRLIASVFKECCKLGLVDEKTYLNVKRALSRDSWELLIHDTNKPRVRNMTFNEIPEEWRINVSSRAT